MDTTPKEGFDTGFSPRGTEHGAMRRRWGRIGGFRDKSSIKETDLPDIVANATVPRVRRGIV